MAFVIKAVIDDPDAASVTFAAHKTMYGGKRIAVGDTVYLFASETGGGHGLVARGVASTSEAVARLPGIERQTPRMSVTVRITARARLPMGRRELKPRDRWDDGQPGTELNFKLYRQATDKIVGISPAAAAFLDRCF